MFFVVVEYYTHHRKSSEPSISVDFAVLKMIVQAAAKAIDLRTFRSFFHKTVNYMDMHSYDLSLSDSLAELKAFVLLIAVALMNVQDSVADENIELIPFFRKLSKDRAFESSLAAFSALVFNVSEFPVSSICKLYVVVFDCFLTVLLFLFSVYSANSYVRCEVEADVQQRIAASKTKNCCTSFAIFMHYCVVPDSWY